MDKYIGRLLDNRYEILEVIGTGGMAVVYKARCHRLNRLVAIKILKDDYLEDEDFRRRFHAESQAVAMLSHPNIVSVYDVSTSIMADYIVMELIEGITLKQYMEKKGVLNWKETLHFAIQIAKALEHAHSRGIVHRDIKPHNVMVLKNGSVKVADFGIARVMSKGNTLTKEALGSVHYISPEQAKGGRVDSRSDIYSLGVVMYEMMSGRPPYDGDSPVAVAIQHINGGAAMPSTLNPNIPGGLEQIIMKAMAHEIGDRYSSAAQMLSDMDEFRKDPTILFDYNTPPLDAVTKLQKPPLVLQTPRTTAERVAGSAEGQGRRAQVARNGDERRSERNQAARRRQREEMEMEEESRSRVATIAIIACSLVAVIAIVVFMITLLGGGVGQPEERVEVPKLVGEVFAELPEYPGLDIIREEVYDEVVAAGTIMTQEPKAGVRVVKGTRVVVTVSKGPVPQVIKMENLVDLTQQRAREILDTLKLNLQIEVEEEYSDEIAQGNVIRTEPQKDTELTAGQKVILYVSMGREIKTGAMPNVIGYKQETAIKTLENQKLYLNITTEEVFDSEIAAGKVVRTEPAKGEELKTEQAVKLYISKGPELATMPNVVGANIQTAIDLLKAAGFGMPNIDYVESNEAQDTVVSQSHEKNVEIDINTKISLEVSKGSKEPDPSENTGSSETQVTKSVMFSLPEDYMVDYTLEIRLGNQVVKRISIKAGTRNVTVSLTGSGKQTYELWIAGAKYSSQEVDFTVNG